MSLADRLRCGEGRRAFSPLSAGGSLEKATSSSGSAARERTATETARLKGSEGDSGFVGMFGTKYLIHCAHGPSRASRQFGHVQSPRLNRVRCRTIQRGLKQIEAFICLT